jgi:predicted unusual protein kinase regulating ubiquinone biosynthesis (AarF/ABC1/UbiB family)
MKKGHLRLLVCLQEGSPPFDDAAAAAIIADDLGHPPSELFSWMSPAPVASASLGQVYQARLAADGTLVAVKVDMLRQATIEG